ncbi:MAG TPA: CsbD family protein [Bacteriovoracaceae bacterium]|nr:CsbD family protein [Bacteriovoracaceae bacterium]
MNNDQIKGNWKQFTGALKEKWGMLTDDELTQAEGRVDFIAGKVQEKYGQTKDDALHQVNEFFRLFDKDQTKTTTTRTTTTTKVQD